MAADARSGEQIRSRRSVTANDNERPIYLTVEGRRRLEQRLQEYTQQLGLLRTPPVQDEARETADEGTELEQADDAARLGDQIALLQQTLARARPLEPGPSDGVVRQGSTVAIEDGQARRRLTLLDGAEIEASQEEIAIDSPVGRALLGRAVGDEVVVQVPGGEHKLRIVSVEPYRLPPS